MQVAETLEGAADLLDQHGWNTGSDWHPNGSMCVRGAIYRAAGAMTIAKDSSGRKYARVNYDNETGSRVLSALSDILGKDAVAWNDGTESKEIVTRTLRTIAAQMTTQPGPMKTIDPAPVRKLARV